MATEEKAKRYDEAIKVAQRFYNNSVAITKKGLEDIFPELRESEDERIRKELLQIAKESEDSFYMVMTPDKRKHLIDWLEKQSKDSPVLYNSSNTGKIEQKPAEWSEEDENKLSDAVFFVREYQIPTRDKRLLNAAKEAEEWLKSIKDRVLPQPKPAEWSEEEEKMFKLTENLLLVTDSNLSANKNGRITPLADGEYSSLRVQIAQTLSWLKSLKERYTWKPSDEQMKALNYVVNLMASSESPTENDYYYNVFKDLREQLEKLK